MNKRLRISHIVNVCNIASILAKCQRAMGHDAEVFMGNRRDPLRFWDYKQTWDILDPESVAEAVKDRDIIHIHAWTHLAVFLRDVLPDKCIIMHYHGQDVQTYMNFIKTAADVTLCCRDDLDRGGFVTVKNPVDLSWWKWSRHDGNRVFWSKSEDSLRMDAAEERIKEFCRQEGLKFHLLNRRYDWGPYRRMQWLYDNHDVYVEYQTFVDYSKGFTLSMTALEALACGLKVYYLPDQRWITEFPMDQDSWVVADKVLKIYEAALAKRAGR